MDSKVISYVVSDTVQSGSAEYYEDGRRLVFHSREDLQAWLQGEPFRLINHWTKPAKPPRGK